VRMVITEKGMNASHVMKTVKHVLIIMYVWVAIAQMKFKNDGMRC
jgi:hypothetical protein